MELILLEKVRNLGNLGDKVKVKPGYGRNYLLPQGKAVPVNAVNLEAFEKRRAEYEAKAKDQLSGAEGRKAKLEDDRGRAGRASRELMEAPVLGLAGSLGLWK